MAQSSPPQPKPERTGPAPTPHHADAPPTHVRYVTLGEAGAKELFLAWRRTGEGYQYHSRPDPATERWPANLSNPDEPGGLHFGHNLQSFGFEGMNVC